MEELTYYPQPHGYPLPTRETTGIFFTGTRKLVDRNNDGVITSEDQYYAASPLPLAHGGFINEIRWKQFDVNIFFTYSIGRHILKEYDDRAITPSTEGGPLTLDIRKVNAWTSSDSKNPDYPRLISYSLKNQYSGEYRHGHRKSKYVTIETTHVGLQLAREDC